jgi:hypothetical protein
MLLGHGYLPADNPEYAGLNKGIQYKPYRKHQLKTSAGTKADKSIDPFEKVALSSCPSFALKVFKDTLMSPD